MTADELHQVLIDEGAQGMILVTADTYALPTRDWVLGAFADALREHTGRWQLGKNDCRIMTARAISLANECHLRTPGYDGKALAVGGYYFWPDGAEVGHVVPVFAVRDGDTRKLLLIEPQTGGSERKLSDSERESCYAVCF